MPHTTPLFAPYGREATVTQNWLANIITAAIFTTIGTITIAVRILNTAILRRRAQGNDDWAIYAAYAASIGYTISSSIALRWGVGLKRDDVPLDWKYEAMKATYAVEIFYYLSIFLVKMSICFMYLRISSGLGRDHIFHRATIWTMGILILHFVSTIVVASVQCVPLDKFLDPARYEHKGRCINIVAFFYSTNGFTILTDFVILALPIRTLLDLQMPARRKWWFVGVFAVGGVSTVASCVRLFAVNMFKGAREGLENVAPINTWSFVEIYTAILCASVPAISALFVRVKSSQGSPNANTSPNNPSHPQNKESAPPAKKPRILTSFTTSRMGDFTFSRHAKETEDEDHVELGPLPKSKKRPKQCHSQMALQSAIMTTSQGSLKRYRAEAGSQGTEGSGLLAGRAAAEVREGV